MANRHTRAAAQSRSVRRLLTSGQLSFADLDAVRYSLTSKGQEALKADFEEADFDDDAPIPYTLTQQGQDFLEDADTRKGAA